MKHVFFLLVGAALTLTGCVSSSSSEDSYSSSDCAITALTMGSLTRTVYTTTADGRDSTYNVAVAGSAFPMYIDQLKQEIYNPDSLPIYTDISKVVLSSVTSDGTVFYRATGGSTDTLLTTKDTLDFSQPKLLTCLSSDGNQSKVYKVTVNVHLSASEDFSWTTAGEDPTAFAGVTAQKAFVLNGRLTVLAIKDGSPTMLTASTAAPSEWTASPVTGLEAMNPEGIVLFNGRFFCADNGTLKTSEDGKEWSMVNGQWSIDRVLAAGRETIYALAGDKIYCSTDGSSWTEDTADADMPPFPEGNSPSVWSPMSFNDSFSFVLIGGTHDGEPCVWRKVVDANGLDTEPWSLFPQGENGLNAYPALPQSAMVAYDSKILYAGVEGDTLSNFFFSSDGGRNWVEQTATGNHPAGIEVQSFSMAADEDNFVWLVCAPSGKVLRGRLNRLGYEENQKVFLKRSPLIPLKGEDGLKLFNL